MPLVFDRCPVIQYGDAFNAYSQAIRINPYISGLVSFVSLCESCNNQISGAADTNLVHRVFTQPPTEMLYHSCMP